MQRLSNMLRPGTPYDADKRPFPKSVHLVTGMAMQWADGDDGAAAAVSAAAVFIPVHRTQPTALDPGTLHFGFVAAIAESGDDTEAVLRLADGILVQARREAAGLAWHAFPDDLYLTTTALGDAGRLPGFTAVGAAWPDRTVRERGTARLIDTAADLGSYALPAQAAIDHGLHLGPTLTALQDPPAVQQHVDFITEAADASAAEPVQHLAAGILGQALSVALLGGKALGLLSWAQPLVVGRALEAEAWPILPAGDDEFVTALSQGR